MTHLQEEADDRQICNQRQYSTTAANRRQPEKTRSLCR
jgi:hypothetical protein